MSDRLARLSIRLCHPGRLHARDQRHGQNSKQCYGANSSVISREHLEELVHRKRKHGPDRAACRSDLASSKNVLPHDDLYVRGADAEPVSFPAFCSSSSVRAGAGRHDRCHSAWRARGPGAPGLCINSGFRRLGAIASNLGHDTAKRAANECPSGRLAQDASGGPVHCIDCHCRVSGAQIGSAIRAFIPPSGRLFRDSSPPWASTVDAAMARPSPIPPLSRLRDVSTR